MKQYDVIILGAGAAGLMAALVAGQRGRRVLLIDHADEPGKKILISGGGRCNFTNIHTAPDRYLSANPHYMKSALARYTARDFIDLVERHGIAWHEKHKGQLFCDGSSAEIIDMLLRECDAGGVVRWQPCAVAGCERPAKVRRLCAGHYRRVRSSRTVLARQVNGDLHIQDLWGPPAEGTVSREVLDEARDIGDRVLLLDDHLARHGLRAMWVEGDADIGMSASQADR